jgi:serine/threonine protein kinase
MTLDHPGVVKLLSVIQSRKGIYLVLEYGGYDLAYQYDILNQHLNEFQIKQLSRSLLEVLSYMHQNNIIHRDLKLSNILISSTNKLKLCDFGLSKILESTMTSGVATLWYRAPELLFEDSNYDTSIDMWSFGCIFAELLNKGKPVLPGKSPSGQLDLISGLIGPPSLSIWPGFAKFSSYIPPSDCHNTLQVKFQEYSSECVDFLNSLLVWDPAERLTAAEALMSSYLKS